MAAIKVAKEAELVNRKFEANYMPKVAKAIAWKKKQVASVIESNGVASGIKFLQSDIGNEKVTQVVEDLYLKVGLRFARMNYSRMLDETGKKSFGFNTVWTNYIIAYFRNHLIEKITYKVADTTRKALLAILTQAVTEGWGIDKAVSEVTGWDERYQAARVVRTEVNRASNVGAKANSDTLEYQQRKEWVSLNDNRVRGKEPKPHANHVKLNGVKIDAEDKFQDSVNGDILDFPGDITASAESTINCRCHAVYTAKRDANGNLIPKRKTTTVIYPGGIPRRRTVLI